MIKTKIHFIVIIGLFVSSFASAQDLKKIKIGYPAISYNQIHIWVAKTLDCFASRDSTPKLFFSAAGRWRRKLWWQAIRPSLTLARWYRPGFKVTMSY